MVRSWLRIPGSMHRLPQRRLLLALMPLSALASAALADGETPKPKPTTTANPQTPVDQLRVVLVPLTKEELTVEVDGWMGLVKAVSQQIAQAELAAKQADSSVSSGDRAKLLEQLPKLRDQRTQLVDRTREVIAAWTAKGGKVADQELYLTAVSGLNLDVKDTGAAWTAVRGWLSSGEGGLRWAKNIAFFLLTLFVFRVIAGLAARAVRSALSLYKGIADLLRDFLINSTRKIVFLVGLVVALSMLEVNIGPFVAAIGAVGFVIGFALQGTLSNFAAGVMILLYRPYDLGDQVTAGGVSGKVESMSLVSTTIKTDDKKTVMIPNSAIWGSAIQVHGT